MSIAKAWYQFRGQSSWLSQIARRTDVLRCPIDAVLDSVRVHEVLAEVWDVFEEHGRKIQADVIEEHEVLVELSGGLRRGCRCPWRRKQARRRGRVLEFRRGSKWHVLVSCLESC